MPAVDRRPAASARRPRPRQVAQGGVLAQAADHGHLVPTGRPQHLTTGVGPVRDRPQRHAPMPQPHRQPVQQLHRQRQLGAERPAVLRRQPRHVFLPHIQARPQRQGDAPPPRVAHQPGQRHPDVAVDKLLPGRPRRRVVVDAGPLHARAVALRRRVVQAEQQTRSTRPQPRQQHEEQQPRGHPGRASPHRPQQGVGRPEVVGDARGPQPTGNGAAAAGEHDAAQETQEAGLAAEVQAAGQEREPTRQLRGHHP